MAPDPNPARAGGACGSGDLDCWAAIGTSDNTTRPNLQDNSRAARHLQVVAPSVPPRPQPRYEVRIAISPAVGRSRPFHLSESDIDLLIAAAVRMEAMG
jgi:hypothetical protein